MRTLLRIAWPCALLCAAFAYACDNGDDAITTEDSGLMGSSPAGADVASHPGDTCTPAGGECLTQGAAQSCAHFGLTELYCGSEDTTKGASCCLDRFFAACDQGQSFPIVASDYDQSCQQASDCISIGEGDGCNCGSSCPNAAINVAGQAKWLAKLQQTPAGAARLVCNCPAFFGIDCIVHRCVVRHPVR
jgi:hypothetical protein